MSKFDQTKPHGLVYGESDHHYWQDGKGFDAAGNEVGAAKSATQVKAPDTNTGRLTADELGAMHISKIRGFVAELNGPAQAGKGSKQRLIAWLVENQ